MTARGKRHDAAVVAVALVAGILGVGAWLTTLGAPPDPAPVPSPAERGADPDESRDELVTPEAIASRESDSGSESASFGPGPDGPGTEGPGVPGLAAESDLDPPPAGTLEILVTVDGAPQASGRVILDSSGPTRGGIPSADLKPNGARLGHERDLDTRGIASFEGVEPGLWWVAVALGADHLAQRTCAVPEEAGARITIALTSSSVYGTVYDDEGNGVSDAWVALSPLVGRKHWQIARADATGAYRFPFAQPGSTWIVHYPGKRFGVGRSSHPMEKIRVPESGGLRHDFGTASGLATISGHVLTRSGAPIAGRMSLHFSDVATGGYIAVRVEPESGAFSRELRPGKWKVRVDDPLQPGRRHEIAEFEIGTGDLTRDFEVPGTRIVARVAGAEQPDKTWVSLRRKPGGQPVWRGALTDPGRWVIDGVAPGDWFLTASAKGGLKAEPIPIQVSESDALLEFDLTLEEN